MPELRGPLLTSLMIFICTFSGAVFGLILHKILPDNNLGDDSKDVIKLVMGLVATMAALVLSLLIASANSSYETQSSELQKVSAIIIELDVILAHYGPDASEARQRLRAAVSTAVENISAKDGLRPEKPTQFINRAEAGAFYDSIARLSPGTQAQHFIQNRAFEISGAIRQMHALALEQINNSIPWPFLTVLVLWISMLFVGFGLFARANVTVIAALLTGALSVSSAIFLILELSQPYQGLMRISGAPLRNALAQIGQ